MRWTWPGDRSSATRPNRDRGQERPHHQTGAGRRQEPPNQTRGGSKSNITRPGKTRSTREDVSIRACAPESRRARTRRYSLEGGARVRVRDRGIFLGAKNFLRAPRIRRAKSWGVQKTEYRRSQACGPGCHGSRGRIGAGVLWESGTLWETGVHRGWGMVLWQTGTRRDESVPGTGGGDL